MTNLTIEEFRRIHEAWQHSGLSIRQYCEDTGIRESRFYYWKAKLKAESQSAGCGGFIPVKMAGKCGTAYTESVGCCGTLCEVVYPNGVTVRVTSDMTLDQLRQMITLLR